jgi:acetyl esterase/lipase
MIAALLATTFVAVGAGTSAAVGRIADTAAPAPITTRAQAERLIGTTPDPNGIAMVFSVSDPCTSPCWKQGLVYQRTGSALDPDGGIKPYALDLYRSSRTPARQAPVVVLLHGGGFVTGDKTQMRPVAEGLANAGFLVASLDYRMVPESRNGGVGIASDADLIPASAEVEADTQKAMRWIRAHRGTLGAATDRRRYGVGGYSAGAIAALRVAVRGGDQATAPALRWRVGAGFAIAGSECGAWTKAYHCAAAYDRRDPPIQMFHGEADSVVPLAWGRATCEAAVLRGGGCTGAFYPNQDHFWPNGTIFGGGDGLNRAHPAVVPTIATFLRRALAVRPLAASGTPRRGS